MRSIKDYIKFISEQDAPQVEAVRPNLDQWRTETGSPNAPAAAAPAQPAAPATSAATGVGNPGEEAAAQANPAPAKSQQNYNMALQQIKALYAKAQVAYPPQDDIIRQRFGLPPALPPFEQWDGKMPEAGKADFLTRNVFGRQASKDVAAQNDVNKLSAAGAGRADATVAAKVKELNALVAKLGSTLSAPEQAAADKAQASVGGGMTESADLKRLMAEMLKEDFNLELPEADAPAAAPAAAPAQPAAAPAGGPQAELIKQIQAVMAEINANMDQNDPDPEATKALQAAQAAMDKAQADAANAPKVGEPAKADPTDPSSADAVNGMDKASDDAAAASATTPGSAAPAAPAAAPANQTFGQAFAAARKSGAKEFEYKGKKYSTAVKGENPALDAAMAGKKPAAPAQPAAPATPAKPAAPTQKELPPSLTKPAAPAQSGQASTPAPGSFAADMAARKKAANPLGIKESDNVGYSEDQTLARIISLANIR